MKIDAFRKEIPAWLALQEDDGWHVYDGIARWRSLAGPFATWDEADAWIAKHGTKDAVMRNALARLGVRPKTVYQS
jgi:hypothetical protein